MDEVGAVEGDERIVIETGIGEGHGDVRLG
jgi:hypothetical protein